jgi:sodium-dependent dicarboxylate transporter 2/3/5
MPSSANEASQELADPTATGPPRRSGHRGLVQKAGLLLGPLVFVLLAGIGPFDGLARVAAQALNLATEHADVQAVAAGAQATLALMALMVVWWITEAVPLPVTALAPALLLPLLHVTGASGGALVEFQPRVALAGYAHPIIFLFLGGFLIAGGMRKTGLAERITLRVLSLRAVTRGAGSMIFCVMLVTAGLSMVISNTATTALMLPIALSMLTTIGELPTGSRLGVAMMLGIGWAASIGGLGTLIGSPPNLIAAGNLMDAGFEPIGFLAWMRLGLPIALVVLVAAWGLLMILHRPAGAIRPEVHRVIADRRAALGRMTADEKVVVGVVVLIAVLWLTRRYWPVLLPDWLAAQMAWFGVNEIGLLGGVLMFIVPVERRGWRAVLQWTDARCVDWGTLLLFGGGLALSSAMFKTGVTDWIAGGLVDRLGGFGPLVCLFAIVMLVDYLTEITSNTAVATMIAPIAIATAPGLGLAPETLCMACAMGASLAFMLPVATPPNALVFATGYFRIGQMVRAGFFMNLIGCGIMVLMIWWLCG